MDHISPVLWQFLLKWLTHFALFPPEASTIAPQTDALYFFMVLVSLIGLTLVVLLIVGFSILYSKKRHPKAVQIEGSTLLEATWTIIPLGLFLVMFVWGALLYFRIYTPPANAMNIYVVGKQWMWKAEHPGGQHEINSLHVPMGQPVQFTLISQDVFHSFSIPAFRVKREAIPGRYTTVWFEATAAGHLSPLLHAVLRHQPLADDRRRDRDDARRLQEVAGELHQRQLAGAEWRAAVRQPELQRLPQHAARRARPQPGRCLQRARSRFPAARPSLPTTPICARPS